jgi:hypothetical protein
MRFKAVATMIALLFSSTAFAIPGIQLFIAGGHYDTHSRTWEITGNSFDLYVVSANQSRADIIVSMALGSHDNPADLDLTFAGNEIQSSSFVRGYAPIDNFPEQYDGDYIDLHPHNVYPTWFTEMHTGPYDMSQQVGDVRPLNYTGDFWNPSTGEGTTGALGQARVFHVETGGVYSYIHFDAYTLNTDGSINEYASFSRDAQANYAPEPGTVSLLGMGLLGLGAYIRRKKVL